MDAYLGEIRLFPFNFVPFGWLACNGQPVPIQTYSALFTIIGTMYGGDGRMSFNLPQLVNYSPVNQGQGPGLTSYSVGMVNGINTVNLITSQIPQHIHHVQAAEVTLSSTASTNAPANAFLDKAAVATGVLTTHLYSPTNNNTALAGNTIGVPNGASGTAHDNHQPYLALQYCICTNGVFPPRG